jgi:hypothetical protein
MEIRLEREALYRAIWAKPLRAVAADFGLSDTGLRKVCIALNVPMPPRGHWAKKAAGLTVVQPPLPEGEGATTFISRPQPRTPDQEFRTTDDDRWFAERIAFEASQRDSMVVPDRPRTWHPVVAKLRDLMVSREDQLLKSRAAYERLERTSERRRTPELHSSAWDWKHASERGELVVDSHRPFPVRASIGHFERALALLNAIVRQLEARGYRVSHDNEAGRVVLDGNPGRVEIRIAERLEARKRLEREGLREREVEYRVPTGQLRVFVEADLGSLREISDRVKPSGGPLASARLEDRLPEVFQVIYRQTVQARIRKRQNDAMHAEWEAERAREQAEEERQAQEQRRRERLLEEVRAWQKAVAIRTYVREAEAASGGSRSGRPEWVAWALAYADEIDPILSARI